MDGYEVSHLDEWPLYVLTCVTDAGGYADADKVFSILKQSAENAGLDTDLLVSCVHYHRETQQQIFIVTSIRTGDPS